MKFEISITVTTPGNHDAASMKAWLTALLSSAMQSESETNTLETISVKEVAK